MGVWSSGSDEFANDVAASEKTDEPSAADYGYALDILVGHERGDVGERLLGRDAEHLACHDVAHGPAPVRARRSESGARADERRRHEMSHELPLAEEPEETAVVVDDWKRAEASRKHLARRFAERHLRRRGARALGHEI